MPHGREYSFGQLGSAVQSVSLSNFLLLGRQAPAALLPWIQEVEKALTLCEHYLAKTKISLYYPPCFQHKSKTQPYPSHNPHKSTPFFISLAYLEMEFLRLDLIYPWKLYCCQVEAKGFFHVLARCVLLYILIRQFFVTVASFSFVFFTEDTSCLTRLLCFS